MTAPHMEHGAKPPDSFLPTLCFLPIKHLRLRAQISKLSCGPRAEAFVRIFTTTADPTHSLSQGERVMWLIARIKPLPFLLAITFIVLTINN
jgi:hypothetical protein